MNTTSSPLLVLVGLTAIVAALVAVVVFAMLRFMSAARGSRRTAAPEASDGGLLMTTAIREAVARLREQERALEARAEASERLSEEIVAGIASGFLLVGASGEVRMVNPAARRLLGLDAGGAVAGTVGEVVGHVAPLVAAIDDCRLRGRSVVRRTLDVSSSGLAGVTHLGVTASPVVSRAGELQAVVCLFSDLSEVMAQEEQSRLKDSLARLGELTAGLAHEFRNSLATIHGYAQMLDPSGLAPRQAACVDGIRDETRALGEMVTNFLNFARPTPLSLAPVDLAAIVSRLGAEYEPELARRGGTFRVDGRFATVEGDDMLLGQALDNLCRNAVQAWDGWSRDAGGRTPTLEIIGEVDADRGLQRVRVVDNGPGIAREALDRLFQPFFTTRSDGTGLGLALVQKIVVTHNGHVAAANRPDGGARFEITLPLN